jgi:hypothetical protein
MAAATKGNLVDNVEQVLIDTPVAGRKYRIEVSNKEIWLMTVKWQLLKICSYLTGLEPKIDYNNFNIESKSETCSGKNNGEINISANQTFNYTAKVNGGNTYTFTNNKLNYRLSSRNI